MKKKKIFNLIILTIAILAVGIGVWQINNKFNISLNKDKLITCKEHIDKNEDMFCDVCKVELPFSNYAEFKKVEAQTTNNNNVEISGYMPKNSEANITRISDSEAKAIAQRYKNISEENVVSGFDISINSKNIEYQPADYSQKLDVTISNLELDTSKTYALLHIIDENNYEILKVNNVTENEITFTASRFSTYIIITVGTNTITFDGENFRVLDSNGNEITNGATVASGTDFSFSIVPNNYYGVTEVSCSNSDAMVSVGDIKGKTCHISTVSENLTISATTVLAPSITTQPVSMKVEATATATFTVTAENATTYTWQYRENEDTYWKDVTSSFGSGYNTATFSLTNTILEVSGYEFRCLVGNENFTNHERVASDIVRVSVAKGETVVGEIPIIMTQPNSDNAKVKVNSGCGVYSVTAMGGSDMTFTWEYRENENELWKSMISGVGSATLSTPSNSTTAKPLKTSTLTTVTATYQMSGYQFRCLVGNSFYANHDAVKSDIVTLSVADDDIIVQGQKVNLKITKQPETQKVVLGQSATFSVTAEYASGYQWQYLPKGKELWVDVTSSMSSTYNKATMTIDTRSITVDDDLNTLGDLDGALFRCVITSSEVSKYTKKSDVAALSVAQDVLEKDVEFTNIIQPEDVTTFEGKIATFTAGLGNGGNGLNYEWHEVIGGVDTNLVEQGPLYMSTNRGQANSTSNGKIVIKASGTTTVSFDYKVSSEANNDKFTITVEDKTGTTTVANQISGIKDWVTYTNDFTANDDGEIVLNLTYSKNDTIDEGEDAGYIRNLKATALKVVDSVSTFEDDDIYEFTNPDTSSYSSAMAWSATTIDGVLTLQSTNAGVSSSYSVATILMKNIPATGTLSFEYRASSESANYDYFQANLIDANGDVQLFKIGGTGTVENWTNYSGSVTPDADGNVKLTLLYRKDGSVNKGDDLGAIRNLKINAERSVLTNSTFENDDIFNFDGDFKKVEYIGANTNTLTIVGELVTLAKSGAKYYCDIGGLKTDMATLTVKEYTTPKLMERESSDYTNGGSVYYAIGAKRSGNTKYTADLISSITFVENTNVPSDAEASWDASYTSGDMQVIAWVVPNGDLYDLYIGADDTIIEAPENSRHLFAEYSKCISINNIGMLDTSEVTTMTGMFSSCTGLRSLDLSDFSTSKVIEMISMFYYCWSLTSLDVSNFDTSNVTNMQYMFYYCWSLTSLDVSNFDTSNVTNMDEMFSCCSKLTSLDLSNFDTSSITDMNSMFYNCSSLISLDVSGFDTSNVTTMYSMFNGCSGLQSLDLSNFDTSKVTNMNYMFFTCIRLKSINIGPNFDRLNGEDMFTNCLRLTAIITPRTELLELSDEATISTGLKARSNIVLYVPSTTAEATFEANANYMDIFGADRIRPILEVNGENPVTVKVGATYDETVDAGATVAGFTKENASEYTQYGYNYTASGLPVDTSAVGTKQVTYTLTKTDGNVTTNGMTTTRDVTVKILNMAIATVTIAKDSYEYIGSEIKPEIIVKMGSQTLTENINYDVDYKNNTNVGTATIVITGKGDYEGIIEKTFEITKRGITIIANSASKVYDGTPLTDDGYIIGSDWSKLEVGDYVVLPQDTNKTTSFDYTTLANSKVLKDNYGITSSNTTIKGEAMNWRVLDIDEETGMILLTTDGAANIIDTVSGKETGVIINGDVGFVNAISELNRICEELFSITYNGKTYVARSLNAEDINALENYDEKSHYNGYRWAFYPKNAVDTPDVELNGKIYPGTRCSTSYFVNGMHTFYMWNHSVTGEKIMSTSITDFKIPTNNSPVLVESNCYRYALSQKIGNALGNKGSWLATSAVNVSNEESANWAGFRIMVLESTESGKMVLDSYYVHASSGGYGSDYSLGIRPVISINAGLIDFSDDEKDGTTLETAWELKGDSGLVLGHKETVTVEGSQTEAGMSDNVITSVTIEDANGNDVTGNYDVKRINGNLLVTPEGFEEVTTELTEDSFEYDGTAKEPEPIVKDGDKVLKKDEDYELGYENNINASSGDDLAKIYIIGKGNYTGTKELTFEITKKPITIKANDAEKVYDSTELKCDEYTITNGSLVSTHTMQVTIVGSQLLVGSSENIIKFVMITDENGIEMNQNYDITLVNGTLTVTKASIAFDIAISGDAAYGERLEALIENLDPEGANISYKWYVNDSNSTEGGTLLLDENGMPITGEYYTIVDEIVNKYIYVEVVAELENYEEKIIKKVVGPIVPANINLVDAYLSQTMYTYDGTAKEPIVFVADNRIGKALTKDIDYTLEYKNNIDVGTASVIVKGVNNYDGEVKLDFKIIKLPKVILTNMNPDWTKDSVPIEISITDEGEGVENVVFRRYIADASYLEETVVMNGNVAMVYAVDNGYYACVVTDIYGNEVTENININNIDKERPIINSVTYDDTTFVTSVSVSVSATDYDSGIYGYGFSETMTEPSNWISFNPVSNSLTFETEITKNGKYYLFVRDVVGNVTMYSEQIVIKNVDNEAPVIKSFDIAEDYTFMADVFISIKAEDDTSVESLLLSNTALSNTSVEESTEWIPYTETVLYRLPMADGEHTVYAWVRDAVGKISEYAFDKTLLLSKYIGNSGVNNTTLKFLVKDENYDFTRKLTESNIKVLVKDEDGNVTYSSDYGIDITAISLPTVYGPVQQGTQVLEGEYYTITVQNIRGEGTVYLVFDENAVVDLAGNKLENAEIETDVIVELNAPTIKIVDDEIQVADVDNHLIQAIKINGKTVLLSGGKITLQKLDSEYGIVLKTGDIIEAYDMCGNIGSMEFDENN